MMNEEHTLRSFLSRLTPTIEDDLPSWFGEGARLAGDPVFSPRPWSYFFRYVVNIDGAESKGVLVKIRHAADMDLEQAVASPKMRREAGGEYRALVDLQSLFQHNEYASSFFTIRPLAVYEELNALVMEEADIHPLKSFLQSPGKLRDAGRQRTFEKYLEDTGRWLRIFHDSSTLPGNGRLFDEIRYESALADLNKIASRSNRGAGLLRSGLLDKLYEEHRGKNVPYRVLHDDYNLSNVFVSGDERICSSDPKNHLGPLYIDLAKFITDLDTVRGQVLTNGLWMPRVQLHNFHEAFLRGYFGPESPDADALRLSRFLRILEKWRDAEDSLESASKRQKIVYSLAMPQMRGYFLKLVRRLHFPLFHTEGYG